MKTLKCSARFTLKNDIDYPLVILVFTYDSNRIRISTRQSVNPLFWDKEKQRVKNTVKINSAEINNILNEMQTQIIELYHKFISEYQRKPGPTELKSSFNLAYFEQKPQFTTKKIKSLLEVFDEYIENKRIENIHSTVQKYIQAKNNLVEFGKLYKQQIQFENITMSFRNKYVRYLQEDKNYADSTVYRKLKFFKTILNYALDCGYVNSLDINLNKFLTKDRQSEKIALSEYELLELESLDLSKTPRLDHVRDRFLIGCYTGMRFSDFIRLNKNHIEDGKYINIQQQKTKTNITIPLFDEVKRIFEKYEYNLPKSISEPKFNEYLKEITQQCENLKKMQEITQFVGNKEQRINTARHNLVTTHTARRTFVTLNHAKGIDLETLTIATGHTTVKALKTYVKLNNKQQADVLENAFDKIKENQQSRKTAKVIKLNIVNQ